MLFNDGQWRDSNRFAAISCPYLLLLGTFVPKEEAEALLSPLPPATVQVTVDNQQRVFDAN